MKNTKKVRGFVLNKKTGHPSYAYKQKFDIVSSLGFTHNKNDFASKKELKHNINPYDNSPCYVKTKVENQKFNKYKQKDDYVYYRIHMEDKALIDKIISKNKKRR